MVVHACRHYRPCTATGGRTTKILPWLWLSSRGSTYIACVVDWDQMYCHVIDPVPYASNMTYNSRIRVIDTATIHIIHRSKRAATFHRNLRIIDYMILRSGIRVFTARCAKNRIASRAGSDDKSKWQRGTTLLLLLNFSTVFSTG